MVYVDNMNAPYGRMVMCHMIADTTSELLAMADKIGVDRKHIQKKGTYQEHFDICRAKKSAALRFGAQEITKRQLAVKTLMKKSLRGYDPRDTGQEPAFRNEDC